MTFNFATKTIELSEEDQGMFMRIGHSTKFSTGQLVTRLMTLYTSNLEQDLYYVIEDLEETDEL